MNLHTYLSKHNLCVDDIAALSGYTTKGIINAIRGPQSSPHRFMLAICHACKGEVTMEELAQEIIENKEKKFTRIYPCKRKN